MWIMSMFTPSPRSIRQYGEQISRALATWGGHLSIGRGGFTLHYDHCRLSGYDCDVLKAECIAAGLPVIDSRELPLDVLLHLAVGGPMIAVGSRVDPPPHHALSYASLVIVAEAYRKAGAAVFNIPAADTDEAAGPSDRRC